MTTNIDYLGSELEVFSHATNWKAYWSNAISRYIGKSVVDVGAGIGATAQTLKSQRFDRWVELEPDPEQAKKIRRAQLEGAIPADYEIVCGISRDLDPRSLFDTALYIDVLEHIKDDREELETISNFLVPGGHIVVVAPAHTYLYTEFDKKIGHFRRYDRNSLIAIKPKNFEIVKIGYLDSVGMLASLANRFVLRSGTPSLKQVKLWDGLMVPMSRLLDKVLMHRIGKSIVFVLRKGA
ncbi:bifunctional 2-polyprenyl-6-hydroxyphenol methylase/3-demethylubiquinol 3-O-methyltransferase UbiG [Variovorax sp. YR216]|uniref:class I SAM-dependent methyltransferase n=1 Tax=Variovorax sp. YR216 TaxID=1882828 RepID=UPI00089A96DB|nr:class I SAM-dependent methyltransferase [Variovorax sp. YR216]SEA73658.1 Methyltransferase domain-containing protein [Variovorax sp. YR216]